MSNLHSEASYENLFNEISTFLLLKDVHSRKTEVSPVTSEESSDNTLISVPELTYGCGGEPQDDSQLESSMVYDSIYNNNVLVDITSFNTAKKTENTDESQYKNASLEDFKCHASNSNENQSNTYMVEQASSESTERIKYTDVNCETRIQELCSLQNSSNFNENERSSPNNVYSEGIYETKDYKKKHSAQGSLQDEERHCYVKDGKTGIERKNFEGTIVNVAQQIEQVETKEKVICCITEVDAKMPDEIQCCQIVEPNTLIDQQHFSTSLSSSEIHDPLDINIYLDNSLNKSEVKNKETAPESHLCQSTESLQALSSPDKRSDSDETCSSENRCISGSSDDGEFKTTAAVPVDSVCANSNTAVNLINKPMVYSGEIAKLPCVAINKALSNFRLKLSNQPKQVYIPSRFLHRYNVLKSKSERNISSESNVPILTPISPVMQIYPNIFSLSAASTSSSPQRQTINHAPTSLGVKKEKRNGVKTVVLKSILPSTIKIVATHVSVSGSSPVASSGIYSTAGICDQKVQLLGNFLPKITPLILPSTETAVGNTEVTATQSSCSELTSDEIPVTALPSMPKEFSDAFNTSITSQSTAVSTVKIATQDMENKGCMNNPTNQNVFIEDLSCQLSSTNKTSTSSSTEVLGSICKSIHPEISSTESNKLNPLPYSDALWTNDAMVHNKGKEQMVKAHSNSNDMNIGNIQIIKKFRLGSRTTWKKKNKCEGAIGMTKTIDLVHSTRKHRKILPKCGNENKCKEKPNDHGSSSITEIEQKNKKTVKVSWNRISKQRNKRIKKSNTSIVSESLTNKSNILNIAIVSPLGNEKIVDNLHPKHVNIQSQNKPSTFIESNILQNLSGKAQYSESTSQGYICSPSWISAASDKKLHEATFVPHEVNNGDSNSLASVFKLPSVIDDHYQTKHTQRCSPHSDTASSSEQGSFAAEHGQSRQLSYNAAYGINANKGFNNFPANNQTSPLHGTFSTSINDEKYKTQDLFSSTVQQMVPTSQIANPCLSNGDVNMFLKDNRLSNYSTKFNTDNCKFTQKTYSNVSSNENNWHISKELEYVHQQLSKLSQSDKGKSLGNKYSTYCRANNGYENEIGLNIQNSNYVINKEENNLFSSGKNFNDMLTEPCPSTKYDELITFLNYKKYLMEYLHGKVSVKNVGYVQQLQNEAMQKHSQNNENKRIPPIYKQERTNVQHFGKCYKRKRKTKGPSKSAVKLERDKPYVCCYCGKSEQYKAILHRHIILEHTYMPPGSSNI